MDAEAIVVDPMLATGGSSSCGHHHAEEKRPEEDYPDGFGSST
jgi:uracil phosphoribosyltransferase